MFCTKVLVTISVENGPMTRFLNCMALPILISLSIVTISWHIRRALSSSCCFLTRIASFRINSSTPDTLPLAARGIRRINTLFRTSHGLRVAVFVSGNGNFCGIQDIQLNSLNDRFYRSRTFRECFPVSSDERPFPIQPEKWLIISDMELRR